MNNKKLYKTIAERGGLMIEALAMLGLIAVVTPTMYKKSAERTLEVEDINTAGVMRTYMGALDAYIAANYADLMNSEDPYILVTRENLEKYLPYNFQIEQSLYEFHTPVFKVVRRSNNLTAFAVFPAKSAADKGIGQERTARIAALVGSNGGYIVDTDTAKARGIGGIWTLDNSTYSNIFNDTDAAGANKYSIVISSSNVVNGDMLGEEGEPTKYLQRTKEDGTDQEWRNTMRTDLYLGGKTTGDLDKDDDEDLHSIRNVNSLIIGAEKGFTDSDETIVDGEGNAVGNYGLFINKAEGTNADAFIGGTLTAAAKRFFVSDEDFELDTSSYKLGEKTLYNTSSISGFTTLIDGGVAIDGSVVAQQVDTGKVRATEFEVGSEKIDDANKWLKVNAADGIQITGIGTRADANAVYTTASITNNDGVEIKTNGSVSNELVMTNTTETSASTELKSTGQNADYGISTAATEADSKTSGHVALKSGDWKLQISGSQGSVDDSDTRLITAEFGDNAKTDTAPAPLKINDEVEWTMHDTAGAKPGTVFVRKGMMAVTGDKTDREKNLLSTVPTEPTSAEQGTGIVMANRFVANNLDSKGNLVRVPDLLTDEEYKKYNGIKKEDAHRYDTYMVNPAYTSVMNDIKLTTRGGARLSDILPDFITKGIYVATNSLPERAIDLPDNLNGKDAMSLLTGEAGYKGVNTYNASPLTGYVPAPQCPPGYSRVITVTPSSFQMAQAGSISTTSQVRPTYTNSYIVDKDSNLTEEGAKNYTEPEYNNVDDNPLKVNGTFSGKLSSSNTYVNDANVSFSVTNGNVIQSNMTSPDKAYVLRMNSDPSKVKLKPFVFQQSTWLKTLALPIKKETSDYTQGWAVLMGFLYPYDNYKHFINSLNVRNTATLSDSGNSAYWNIFPVKQDTLEAYVTTYCYFDRGNGFEGFKKSTGSNNTPHQGVKDAIGNFNAMSFKDSYTPTDADAAYRQNLNDPSMKYDELW